jgi:hypothetical protein
MMAYMQVAEIYGLRCRVGAVFRGLSSVRKRSGAGGAVCKAVCWAGCEFHR